MNNTHAGRISVLYGGIGEERAVSLQSGPAIAQALESHYSVEMVELNTAVLPKDLHLQSSVVFPALHGSFGEDGSLQAALEAAGIAYCGSDAAASRLCMAKDRTKVVARDLGIATPEAIHFEAGENPLADNVIEILGNDLVVKPANMGSSVGLHFANSRSALGLALSQVHTGEWLIEQRIHGRELTVGLLEGQAMGVVEVVSVSGVYDYEAKYIAGSTKYLCPAALDATLEAEIKTASEALFNACGCRDFARIDFLLDGDMPYFLEVNTLPGLTASSLLPKSAACEGLGFEALAQALVRGGCERYASEKNGGAQA
ncbi:MAG: D-alanine--D-alanine ligase [Opitutia bacterium UBA7350]|nr:MAG: D-alanine--D-alanine ligase [Opitutae bacterium UBA7350]